MRALLLIALLAAPASAQVRGGEASTTLQDAERRKVVSGFADCVVRRRHDEAVSVVLNNETNTEILERHRRLIDSSCLPMTVGGQLEARFPGDTLRYAIAEALVRADFPISFPQGITATAPLTHQGVNPEWLAPPMGKKFSPMQLADRQRRADESAGFAYLTRFGECVVRADPVLAHRLLLTPPLSETETAAFKALAPQLSGCHEAGGQLKANKATMRGTIAHNFYRLAKAPRVVGVVK